MNFELSRPASILRRVLDTGPALISGSTRCCAVYGHPIRHSASPAMQNAAMARLGLDWRYLAFDVHPDQLRVAIEGAKAMKFIGLNLTVPHKILAMEMVDELDPSAAAHGAVNTIRFETRINSEWVPIGRVLADEVGEIRSRGFNTDADAIIRSIEEEFQIALGGASVLVLGAGGAGRVAALKLAESGVRALFLVNRTASKAKAVADDIRRSFPGVEVHLGYPEGAVDLLLNATSAGLRAEDPLPFDPSAFSLKQAKAVYDMIYRPAETKLLEAARAAGARTANGLGMLLYQGAKALEIWSGQAAPLTVMRRALEQEVYGK